MVNMHMEVHTIQTTMTASTVGVSLPWKLGAFNVRGLYASRNREFNTHTQTLTKHLLTLPKISGHYLLLQILFSSVFFFNLLLAPQL